MSTPRPVFDVVSFKAALKCAADARRKTMKAVAKETGVSASTLSRMETGRRPDAASMAALCAWAGLDHRKYLIEKEATKMDTGNLMSSLREMVTADVHVQMIAAGVLHADADTLAMWQAQYSRHEAVVREHLLLLGVAASSYKAPVRLK